MKILGIITEYNPFHRGHLYQIEEAGRITGADGVVVVMSGNYVQRGEPAIYDKWVRARTAINNGVNLVIELPFVFATLSAEYFAHAGTSLLYSSGVIDKMVFGSECGDINIIKEIANILLSESEEFKSALKKELSNGRSFPTARESAVREVTNDYYGDVLKGSNNILSVEYAKAAKRLQAPFDLVTIKRVGNNYNDVAMSGEFPSSSAIRQLILQENNAAQAIELSSDIHPVCLDSFGDMIVSKLRTVPANELQKYTDVSEGLENRIKRAADKYCTPSEITKECVTSRYTAGRINRIMLHVLTGYTSADADLFGREPPYIRILASDKTGYRIINEIKKNSALPVIDNFKKIKYSENPAIRRMVELECCSTDIYMLAKKKKSGSEFTKRA